MRIPFNHLTLGILTITIMSCNSPNTEQYPKVIAHRGFWKTEGSAQNSIASFEKAIEAECWGSELDVYLTTDNRIVLFHDNRIKLMVDSVERSKRVDSCSYNELMAYTLGNGEKLPPLEEILDIAKKQDEAWEAAGRRRADGDLFTKTIIEIKGHSTPEREVEAARAVHEMVLSYGLESEVEYISFSKVICEELLRLAGETPVAYLNGDLAPKELKEKGYAGLDYNIGVMRNNETWFTEAHDMGLTVNVWTVDTEEDMRYLIEKGTDYITTNEPLLLQKIIGEFHSPKK